jgi:hypothetical protein
MQGNGDVPPAGSTNFFQFSIGLSPSGFQLNPQPPWPQWLPPPPPEWTIFFNNSFIPNYTISPELRAYFAALAQDPGDFWKFVQNLPLTKLADGSIGLRFGGAGIGIDSNFDRNTGQWRIGIKGQLGPGEPVLGAPTQNQ